MFKKIATVFFIVTVSLNTHAQDDSVEVKGWIPSAIVGINLSQLALSNWSQGGENALTWTLFTDAGLNFLSGGWGFKNTLKAAYGRTKLGGAGYRTNENDIYFETVLSRNVGWVVDPYISNLIRTNVAAGYDYGAEPAVKVTDFFDPGYVTQSLGFTYEKLKGFTTRLGFAVQETFTNQYTRYSDDSTTAEIEDFKLETGLESVTSADYQISESLLFKSILRLFTRFENIDVWDVRWDSMLAAKVSDFLDVKLSVLLVYEQNQSLRTQLKEALQLSFFYTIY